MYQEQSLYYPELANWPKNPYNKDNKSTIVASLHDDEMIMVIIANSPGQSIPVHTHEHEQVGMVYSGKAILNIGDEEQVVKQGDFYHIPANVPHNDTCIGDEPFVVLVFFPAGEEIFCVN